MTCVEISNTMHIHTHTYMDINYVNVKYDVN